MVVPPVVRAVGLPQSQPGVAKRSEPPPRATAVGERASLKLSDGDLFDVAGLEHVSTIVA
jgi:hypothetical protein